MTLIKSLAACGMILTAATPVAALEMADRAETADAGMVLSRTTARTIRMPATVAPAATVATSRSALSAPTVSKPVAVVPAAAVPVAAAAKAQPAQPAQPATTIFDFGGDSFASMLSSVNAAAKAYGGLVVSSVAQTAVAVADTLTEAKVAAIETVTAAVQPVVETVTETVRSLTLAPQLSSQPALVETPVEAPVQPAPPAVNAPAVPAEPAPPPAPVAPDVAPDPAVAPPAPSMPAEAYQAPPGNGTVYYVDFANGDDANSGTSAARPWKRAPGDALAQGVPAAVVLKGGDTVRFKGGVSYRGSIRVKFSGTAQSPIVYSGTGFGNGSAIVDGADPVISSVPCPSQSACGGAQNWSSLKLVKYTEPTGTSYRKLFDEAGALFEAKAPVSSDPFWGDNLDEMAVIAKAQAGALSQGRLDNASLAAAAAREPNARLLLWETGNIINERKVLSVSGSTITFDATGLKPYTDRDSRAAVVGAVKAVTKPGLYAVLSPGTAVVYPRKGGGTAFYVGSGRFGFNMNAQSNIVIGGFQFLRGSADSKEFRSGVAIANHSTKTAQNVLIEQNRFANAAIKSGRGIIHLDSSDGVTIRNNSLSDLEFASGMRLFGRNFVVERNRLQRIGRTGIYMGGVVNGTVRTNILSDISSVHGNAMSFYLKNQNIEVSNNCVFNANRPLTWHGSSSAPVVNNLRFIGNILLTTPTGSHASASWGAFTDGVTYRNNLAIGGKYGILLNAKDSNVSVTGNRMRRIVFNGGQPPAWTISNNQEDASYAEVANAQLSMNSCRARGHSGDLVVTL